MTASEGSPSTPTLGVFDDASYAKRALESAAKYQAAAPFPHIVLDDFMPDAVARRMSAACPAPDDIAWVVRDNPNSRRRYQHDETLLPTALREAMREFNSRQFILFLETLTGIEGLLPDPYFIGGGIHISGAGDYLKVHSDFNWHHKLQAYRRVNALFYFTEGWQPEWKGDLELWDREMTGPVVKAQPVFNRMVVFSTGEHSNHGQREPNECPPGVYRKVLNLYYFTAKREDGDMSDPHFTLYKQSASPFAVELGEQYRKSGGQK